MDMAPPDWNVLSISSDGKSDADRNRGNFARGQDACAMPKAPWSCADGRKLEARGAC